MTMSFLRDIFTRGKGVWRQAADRAFAPGVWSSLPTAGVDFRGALARTEGASGTEDSLRFGRKTAANTHEWSQVLTTGRMNTGTRDVDITTRNLDITTTSDFGCFIGGDIEWTAGGDINLSDYRSFFSDNHFFSPTAVRFTNPGADTFAFYRTFSKQAILNTASLTANRTFTFPDATGTLALTSDVGNSAFNEAAQDAVGAMVADGSSVGLTYTDATPSLVANIKIASEAQGDLIYHNGTQWTRLAAGTSGHFLKTQGAGANPTWAAASGGGGLTLITTATFSSASSVSVDSCFSATYDHYRLVVQLDSSSDGFVHLRLRASSTDASGSDYYTAQYFLVTTGNSGTSDTQAGASSFRFTYFDPVTGKSTANTTAVDVFRPFLTKVTQFLGGSIEVAQDNWALFRFNAAGHDLETSYDGFTIYPASGTFTGQYWVYGYDLS